MRKEENEKGLAHHFTGGVAVGPAQDHMTRRQDETEDARDQGVMIGGGGGGDLGAVGGGRGEEIDHVMRGGNGDQDQQVKEDQSLPIKNLQTRKRTRWRFLFMIQETLVQVLHSKMKSLLEWAWLLGGAKHIKMAAVIAIGTRMWNRIRMKSSRKSVRK